jgi:transcriptional regulator with XRE-family HTH domain
MLSVSSIPYRGALFLSMRMDIRTVRRNNLKTLREQAGSVRALADKVETDPNYISQLLGRSSKANVGYDLARRAEQAFNKPEGWMDQPHPQKTEVDLDIEEIEQLARKLNPTTRNAVKAFMRSLSSPPPSITN